MRCIARFSSLTALAFLPLLTSPLLAESPKPNTSGELLFEDSFERDEPTADKEDIGPGWRSNSPWRAAGEKQVDLDTFSQTALRPCKNRGIGLGMREKTNSFIMTINISE